MTKEIERLNMVPPSSPEYNISYTYIDWLLSLPWTEATEDRANVQIAASVLDADHYGLKDVKERILEFLAVHQLKKMPPSRRDGGLLFLPDLESNPWSSLQTSQED